MFIVRQSSWSITIRGGQINSDESKALRDLMLSSRAKEWRVDLSNGCHPADDESLRLLCEAFGAPIDQLILRKYNSSNDMDRRMLECVFGAPGDNPNRTIRRMHLRSCSFDSRLMRQMKASQKSPEEFEIIGDFRCEGHGDGRFTSFLSEVYGESRTKPRRLKFIVPPLFENDDIYGDFSLLKHWSELEDIYFSCFGNLPTVGLSQLRYLRKLEIGSFKQKVTLKSTEVSQLLERKDGRLRSFSIRSKLDEENASFLFEALKNNSSLREIEIQNPIADSTAKEALLDCLSQSNSIKRVILDRGSLNVEFCARLLAGENTSIEMILVKNDSTSTSNFMPLTFVNWSGRRLLRDTNRVPCGLWPTVLSRISPTSVIAVNRSDKGKCTANYVGVETSHHVSTNAMYQMIREAVDSVIPRACESIQMYNLPLSNPVQKNLDTNR